MLYDDLHHVAGQQLKEKLCLNELHTMDEESLVQRFIVQIESRSSLTVPFEIKSICVDCCLIPKEFTNQGAFLSVNETRMIATRFSECDDEYIIV